MSTSSGNAAKGEKGKSSKYHVLDINTLYKSKGNEQEVQLQKSTAPRKHGLQKLGTLPSARRPTNLPSLKAENSNTDSTAVNLVSGSNTRWGNKQGESNQTAPTTESNSTQDISSTTTTGMSQPVQHAQPPHPIQGIVPVHTMGHMLHHGPPDVKTWAMMTHGDATGIIAPSFLTSQSPLFQQEFPSLSNSDTPNGANASSIKGAGVGDMQYGPGPSLRPQTEGSWIQGGNRSQGMTGQGPGNQSIAVPAQGLQMTSYPPIGSDGDRNNLGQSGVGVVPGGPYAPGLISPHLLPPQFRGVMPSFMLRNAYPSGFPPNFQSPPLNRISPRPPAVSTSQPSESSSSSTERNSPPTSSAEELKPVKPVAKEEDVKKVIEIIEETSWAYSEDDYVKPKTNENENDSDKYEKFSDSDDQKLNSSKEPPKIQIMTRDKANYDSKTSTESWQNPRASQLLQSSSDYRSNIPPRFQNVAVHRNADEEDSSQDRRRVNESAIQRARLRKEEEEKRYAESKEAAAKKLKMLEQKIGITSSQEKENKMPNSLFSNREVNIPLPDWEKDKSKSAAAKPLDENVTTENNRKSQPSSAIGRIPVVRDGSEFKELTQIGDRNALSRIKEKERDVNYGSSGGPYSRHMGDIPPRFQKQQQQQSGTLSMQRQNSGSGNNMNVSQVSDMRKNAAFQSQYSSKSSLVSRRDRKDSDISSTENDRWEDERRKDHYSPDVEYNMDKDRFSRNNYRNKEMLDDYDRNNGRDNDFRDRESSVNYKNYSSGGPSYQEYGRDRDYNKRPPSAYYTENSLRDENWPDHDRDRHKSPTRSYEKDSESDNKRSAYAEPVSSVESEHIRECNEQERDRNKGWDRDRDREYDREPDYNRRNTYSSSNSATEPSFRDRQHEQRKTYLNEKSDDVASREYEANNDNEQQTFWEKSVNENERDKRRDYNNKNRTVSESMDSRDNNRRRSYDFYDAKLHQPAQSTEKGRDWADSHERKETYNSSSSRGVDKSPRDNYEGKNEDYKKNYEYDKRDRDYEHGNDIRHDKRSPLSASKTDSHERVRKDSKTSYESFHEDLTNYDDLKTSHSSWAEETELAMKYSRRETSIYKEERNDHRRDYYIHPPRHIPGPITRDRLEASKLDQESKANLTQLVRSSDKRNKKSENAGGETADIKRSNTSLSKEDNATTPDKIENKSDQKVPIKDKQNEIQKESTNVVAKQPALQPQPLMEIKIDPEKDIKDKNISVDDNMKTGNYQKNIGNTSKYPSDSKRSDRRTKSDRGGKRAAAHRPHTHTVYTSKREPIYRGSNQRNSNSRYTNRWNSTHEKKSGWVGSDSADDISVESVKTDDKSHSGYNRNGKSSSRKSERNDGNRNHDYRPQDPSEFYSSSNNRKYDSVRSGRDNVHYNEPSRRGRGGFKGKSGYGPPPTKSPFTKITQSENDKENSRKDSIQSQKGDDQKSSSTVTSADKSKSNNSGNKSHDPNMLSQMKTDIDSKDRGWKGKRNVHSYSSNVYKKSDYLAISHGGGHHGETEEAWETASEGTSTEEVRSRQSKEHLASTTAGSGKRPGSKSKKSNYRSSSRRRNYESRRSMQNSAGKRETQQFYDCRSQVLSKHGAVGKRVNSVGDEQGFDKPALNGDVTENIIISQEKSADSCNIDAKNLDDRSMEPRNISDSFHSSSHSKKTQVKDTRRQKSGLPSSGRSTSSKAANSSAVKNSYNPCSVAPRFQKNKNVPDGKSFSDKDRSSVTSSSSTTFSVNEPGPPRPAPPPTVNAWDKPITASFRSMSPAPSSNSSASKSSSNDNNNRLNDSRNYVAANSANSDNLSTSNASETIREQRTTVNKSSSSLSKQTSREKSQSPSEKEQQSPKILSEKRTIETGGPLQTMIIENTNYKSNASSALDMSSSKVKYDEQLMKTYEKNAANLAFSTGGGSEHSSNQSKHDAMGMASLALNKPTEDGSDMKLDFTFDSADLTEDNKSGKSLEVTHSIQIAHTATAADLNFKIASVKKVWEDGAAIVKFEDDNSGVIASSSFASSFNAAELNDGNVCYVKNGTNSPSGVQVDDVSSLSHTEVYSPVTQIAVVNSSYGSSSNCPPNVMKADPNSSSSNVCKVKPQPQSVGTNASGVTTLTTISASLNTHSPPVSSPSSYTFSSPTPQPNLTGGAAAVALAAAAAAHINFQAAAQYNTMPPIPSPPTMLFSSSPQLPAGAPSGLFQTYQIESTPMISNQPPRSQFGQYPPAYGLSNGLGQTAGFNQQSVYVHQSGPPPPPPPQPSAAPQDIYSSQLPQYRMQAPPPPNFPNSQQLNATPNTVLISSSSNSLMSAGVKPPPQPTTQQIGAMSTKAGYSATPQPSQVYIPFEATQMVSQNYLSGNQMVQPRPGSNVPPPPPPPNAMPPVSSYYSAASSGGGQGAFYQTGGNSNIQPPAGAPPYSITAFNAQTPAPPTLPNFSQLMNQQFRIPFLKGNTTGDLGNTKAVLTSPHELLNTVFPSGPQPISSSSKPPRMQNPNKPVMQPQGLSQQQHSMQQHGSYPYHPQNQGFHPHHHHHQRSSNLNAGGNVRGGNQQYALAPIQRPANSNVISRAMNNPNTINSNNNGGNGNNNQNQNNMSSNHRNAAASANGATTASPSSMRGNSHQMMNNIQHTSCTAPSSATYYTSSSA